MTDTRAKADRDTETREVTGRPKMWTTPSVLPVPTPQRGYSFRWVRLSIRSEADATNFSSKTREGWEPCLAKDHPEIPLHMTENKRFDENVVYGGLILCKMADEMIQQRADHYKHIRESQLQAVSDKLMSHNDPRMPLFAERKSKISKFGSGE